MQGGLEAATVEKIAKRADISRATFYTHFSNRFEAFTALWSVHIDDDLLQLFAELNDIVGTLDKSRIRPWLSRALDTWLAHGAMLEMTMRIVALEPATTDLWLVQNARVVASITNYLEGFDDDKLASAKIRLSMLILQLDRVAFLLYRNSGFFDREPLLDALEAEWWDCLQTGAANRRP